jgi:hypothetical protein
LARLFVLSLGLELPRAGKGMGLTCSLAGITLGRDVAFGARDAAMLSPGIAGDLGLECAAFTRDTHRLGIIAFGLAWAETELDIAGDLAVTTCEGTGDATLGTRG